MASSSSEKSTPHPTADGAVIDDMTSVQVALRSLFNRLAASDNPVPADIFFDSICELLPTRITHSSDEPPWFTLSLKLSDAPAYQYWLSGHPRPFERAGDESVNILKARQSYQGLMNPTLNDHDGTQRQTSAFSSDSSFKTNPWSLDGDASDPEHPPRSTWAAHAHLINHGATANMPLESSSTPDNISVEPQSKMQDPLKHSAALGTEPAPASPLRASTTIGSNDAPQHSWNKGPAAYRPSAAKGHGLSLSADEADLGAAARNLRPRASTVATSRDLRRELLAEAGAPSASSASDPPAPSPLPAASGGDDVLRTTVPAHALIAASEARPTMYDDPNAVALQEMENRLAAIKRASSQPQPHPHKQELLKALMNVTKRLTPSPIQDE